MLSPLRPSLRRVVTRSASYAGGVFQTALYRHNLECPIPITPNSVIRLIGTPGCTRSIPGCTGEPNHSDRIGCTVLCRAARAHALAAAVWIQVTLEIVTQKIVPGNAPARRPVAFPGLGPRVGPR